MWHRNSRIAHHPAALILAMAMIAPAYGGSPGTVKISIGVRETHTTAPIGQNGGNNGGIEWIDLDARTLVLDGTWQLFTFHLASATVTPFAGNTANGILEGSAGVLEHIRIRSDGYTTAPISLWIDSMFNTITPPGSPPTPFVIQNWEEWAVGELVTFQRPRFSTSSQPHLQLTPNNAGVVEGEVHAGCRGYRVDFAFIDLDLSRWVRLTTSALAPINAPNPAIRFDQNSTISFWMRGCVGLCPPPPVPGACCIDGVAITTTASDCAAVGGVFMGEHTNPGSVTCPAACPADIAPAGGDGTVNVSDLLTIINSWGPCP